MTTHCIMGGGPHYCHCLSNPYFTEFLFLYRIMTSKYYYYDGIADSVHTILLRYHVFYDFLYNNQVHLISNHTLPWLLLVNKISASRNNRALVSLVNTVVVRSMFKSNMVPSNI